MPRVPAASTRRSLVEAAILALRELSTADLISAVGTRAIAARAGVSAASVFHHFGSTQGLAEAVLARVYDPRRPPPEIEIGTGMTVIADSSLPATTSLAFHAAEFDRLIADPEHRLRVGLWGLGGAEGRAAYATYLRERDRPLHVVATDLYDEWGREIRPPVTIAGFVAAQAALLSGSVIRGSLDPDSVDRDSFARTAASLSLVMLRMKGERRGLDDRLAEINYFPLPDRGTRNHLAARRAPRRARIVAAARGLLWERGYAATTLGEVARAAAVSTSTVHALFEGKDDLAVACLFAEVAEHVHPPTHPDLTWRRRLLDVATAMSRHAHLTGPYAAELVTAERHRDDDVVLAQVEAALRDAVADADLAPDAACPDVARTWLLVVLARIHDHRAQGPAGALQWAGRMVLEGLRADAPGADPSTWLPGQESNLRR